MLRRPAAALPASVEIVELPLDDSWLRDCGPIYAHGDGRPRGWRSTSASTRGAGSSRRWDRDAAVGGLIAQRLGDPVREAPLVLEGGSILSDGAGTLLTTEQCLLHPSRNPALSREQIEAALIEYLGAARVLWLGDGLVEDRDTDGHVDLIAAFIAPGRVMLQTVDPDNPNHADCEENRRRLEAAGIEVTECRSCPTSRWPASRSPPAT